MNITGNIRTPKESKHPPLSKSQPTRATRLGKRKITDSIKTPTYPQSEDPMEVAGPAEQLVVREPDLWGDSQHDYPQLFWLPNSPPLQGVW